MAKLIVYPETVQFRQTITYVRQNIGYGIGDRPKQLPTLKFTGTVKLHGSNVAIGYQQNMGYWFQSRNRVLSATSDHAGFVEHMDSLVETYFNEYVFFSCPTIREYSEQGATIVIYGEWCGDNIQGQANVAITGLPKMFVIFKIKIIRHMQVSRRTGVNVQEKYKDNRDGFWLDPEEWSNVKWHEHSIYNIYDFPTYEINIDYNNPEFSQNTLTKITEDVERQCPVGTYFNRIGCGEGIVWTEWKETHGALTFKVKGREYSIVNSKILVPTHTLKFNSAQDFIEYACTINRMKQAYNCIHDELASVEAKDFSIFVRWLTEDIIKEEKDTMDVAHINPKDLIRLVTSKSQTWFDTYLIEDRKIKTRKNKTSK